MNEFKRFYLWGMNMKFFMGLYFAAILFYVCVVTVICKGCLISIMTLLQILLVSIAIAVAQVTLLPDSVSFSKGIISVKSVIWLVFSGALTGTVSRLCDWFATFNGSAFYDWSPIVLAIFIIAGCMAMLIGLRFEQESDTLRLNQSLDSFKKNGK